MAMQQHFIGFRVHVRFIAVVVFVHVRVVQNVTRSSFNWLPAGLPSFVICRYYAATRRQKV